MENMEHRRVEQKNQDTQTSCDKKIEDLYHLIEGIRCCMMTTRCPKTGRLVSRCMAPHHPDEHTPADLWFFANNASHKFEELEADPNVNLAFCKESTSEWISVSGKAKVVNDREKIKQLYKPTIKPWFGDLKDGVHDGGPNDPRVSLIFVEAETVHYSKKDTPTPVQIWNIAKGIITGEPRKVSADRNLDTQELQHAREVNQLEDNVVA